jgi:FG-GAP-like repeat
MVPLLAFLLAADFREHVIATDLKGGYQVVAADLNGDGKPDLIALASQMTDLVWFENPTWERHVLASGLTGMINLAVYDTDGDGIPEIALAFGFTMQAATSKGIVAVLKHNGDPRQPWTLTEIDRLPTSHRLRWANIDGSKVLVNAPLIGANAVAPDYRDHVPLVYYRPGEWKRIQIGNENEGIQHGITIVDWDGKGRDSILTSSFSGIDLYRFAKDKWTRTEISKGNSNPWPKSGTSDLAVGHTGKQRFLATIEPWHGNQVAVYVDHRGQWQRHVIDDSLLDAHTILAADLNNDGRDQIVTGMRGKPYQVLIYSRSDNESHHWTRKILDTGSMAAAACAAVDLNADHRIDLACIGSATTNLKWYENLGK